MKVTQKRVADGIENSSLFQNTERIPQPKCFAQERETPKKERPDQQLFFTILQETEVYELYDEFVRFHIEVEKMFEKGDIHEMRSSCIEFKERILSRCTESFQDEKYDDAEKIKELLEEIYTLRKKLAEHDSPLNFDSVSSLDDFTGIEIEEKSGSKSKKMPSNVKQSGSKFICNIIDKNFESNESNENNEAIINFLELKETCFHLLSLIFKLIYLQLPNESSYMLNEIQQVYKSEIQSFCYEPKSVPALLDKIESLTHFAHVFTDQILNMGEFSQ